MHDHGLPFCSLPHHSCYVEPCTEGEAFERGLYRLFTKGKSSIEVFNDHGALSRLFRAVRDCPYDLVAALKELGPGEPELALIMRKLLAAWHDTLPPEKKHMRSRSPTPSTVEELYELLLAPYQRIRTVLFEALDWQNCFKRYDRRGAFQLIDYDGWYDPGKAEELMRLLATSLCSWVILIPQNMEMQVKEMIDTDHVFWHEGPGETLWLISSSP